MSPMRSSMEEALAACIALKPDNRLEWPDGEHA